MFMYSSYYMLHLTLVFMLIVYFGKETLYQLKEKTTGIVDALFIYTHR